MPDLNEQSEIRQQETEDDVRAKQLETLIGEKLRELASKDPVHIRIRRLESENSMLKAALKTIMSTVKVTEQVLEMGDRHEEVSRERS